MFSHHLLTSRSPLAHHNSCQEICDANVQLFPPSESVFRSVICPHWVSSLANKQEVRNTFTLADQVERQRVFPALTCSRTCYFNRRAFHSTPAFCLTLSLCERLCVLVYVRSHFKVYTWGSYCTWMQPIKHENALNWIMDTVWLVHSNTHRWKYAQVQAYK